MIEFFDPNQPAPIQFTEAALSHFYDYLQKHQARFLVLSLKKTGCSGLSYTLEITDTPKDLAEFLELKQKNLVYFVAKKFLPILSGLRIDYRKQAMGISKVVYHNPQETARCGCGESFTISEQCQ